LGVTTDVHHLAYQSCKHVADKDSLEQVSVNYLNKKAHSKSGSQFTYGAWKITSFLFWTVFTDLEHVRTELSQWALAFACFSFFFFIFFSRYVC